MHGDSPEKTAVGIVGAVSPTSECVNGAAKCSLHRQVSSLATPQMLDVTRSGEESSMTTHDDTLVYYASM